MLVAADEITRREDVEGSGPSMRVQRSGVSGGNDGVENADRIVFEEEFVILGCGGQGIKFGGPGLVVRHCLVSG